MSQNDENWTHFNVRCQASLREDAEASAERQGQSFAEWIRRAMQEKLAREKSGGLQAGGPLTDEELDARIEAALRRMMKEAKKEG